MKTTKENAASSAVPSPQSSLEPSDVLHGQLLALHSGLVTSLKQVEAILMHLELFGSGTVANDFAIRGALSKLGKAQDEELRTFGASQGDAAST